MNDLNDLYFPNVRCEEHPDEPLRPGFAVCRHVLDAGAPIAHYHNASPRALGEILCDGCIGLPDAMRVGDLRLICARCVETLLARHAPHP
jgi:hypothetical protein